MRWERMGRLFSAAGQHPWLSTHASMPIAERLSGTLYRVYFTPRDTANRSHVAWMVFDLERPGSVVDLGSQPVLGCGPLGQFDDCGAMTSCLVATGEGPRAFYIGWTVRQPVPFHIAVGIAVPDADGRTWQRHLDCPVLDRAPGLPHFSSTPWVLPIADGWGMWFLAGCGWYRPTADAVPQARYRVHFARSRDLVTWQADPRPQIDLAAGEHAIARPMVLRDPDCWRMWYCHRGDGFGYRLGYAESADGADWVRRDDAAGLAPAESGWDSDMICYPFVFDHEGERFMLYCGNGFSQTGFGLARLAGDR